MKMKGINHILLELKNKNWIADVGEIAFCELLKRKVKSVIIKEK